MRRQQRSGFSSTRGILTGVEHTRRPGESAPELAVARRRSITVYPDCDHCHNLGYLKLPVAGNSATYCECQRGASRRRQDEHDDAEYQRQRLATAARAFDANLGLEGRMREWTLASFPRNKAPNFHNWAAGYAANFKWDRNLIVYGNPGTGKTGLLVSMARALRERAIHEGRTIRFVIAPELFDSLRQGFDDHDYLQKLDNVKHASLLILDDLGTETGSKWEMGRLFDILNGRYNRGLPTWITSNLELTDKGTGPLANWLGARNTSRLLERGDLAPIKGRDLRLS